MNKQALIEFTQKLVRQQSLSGEEGPVTQIVVEEMRRLGFDKVWVDENGSAIGVVEGKQTGRTILFDAQTDTVGIAPGSVWTKDPFGGDFLDGYLARRSGQITKFGIILDPIADKFLVISALILLVDMVKLSAWVGIAIIVREFLATALRVVALSKNIHVGGVGRQTQDDGTDDLDRPAPPAGRSRRS